MTIDTMTDDEMDRMPWTQGLMSEAEFRKWLASREQAGGTIDIDSCEIGKWATCEETPYLTDPDVPNPYPQVGNKLYVRGPESRGWVWEGDLPQDKLNEMYARLHREREAWSVTPEGVQAEEMRRRSEQTFYERDNLELKPSLRNGKPDLKAWMVAMFLPRLRGTMTCDQLARFLGDNERHREAACATDPALRREIEDAVADQWRKLSQEVSLEPG